MTGAAEQIKHILANFKNYQVTQPVFPYSSALVIQAEIGLSAQWLVEF